LRNALARLQEPGDRLPDRHNVARLRADTAEDTVGLRLDLNDGLVGLDLEEHLAFLDLLALFLQPRDELARFLRHLERRHHH
jgi:hypothetical protein